MNRPTAALVVLCLAFGLAGCDSPTRTVETTRRQITEFQAAPNEKTQAAVQESLAKLDAQVEALEKKGDTIQADLFRREASRLRSDFQATKISKAFRDAKNAIQGIGDAFQKAGKIIGDTLKDDETNAP